MTQTEPASFTLMTLNLRFGLAHDGDNGWEFRKTVFPEMLAELNPDFLCVQEANGFQIDDLASLLAGHGRTGQRRPAPRFWQNNVIFYRKTWALVSRDHFFLSPTPDTPSRFRNSRWPRQCSLGLFQNNTRRLVVASTHLDFDPQIQKQSAGIILNRLARRAPRFPPTVVAGDFNAGPDSPCLAAFTAPSSQARFKAAAPSAPMATAHGFTGETQGQPIDWILCRNGLVSESARVITRKYRGRYPSDHFPVLARLRFLP